MLNIGLYYYNMDDQTNFYTFEWNAKLDTNILKKIETDCTKLTKTESDKHEIQYYAWRQQWD